MPRIQLITGQTIFRREYKKVYRDYVSVSCYTTLRDGLRNALHNPVDLLAIDAQILINQTDDHSECSLDDSWLLKITGQKNIQQGEIGIVLIVPDALVANSLVRSSIRRFQAEGVDIFRYNPALNEKQYTIEDFHAAVLKTLHNLHLKRATLLLQQENSAWSSYQSLLPRPKFDKMDAPPPSFLCGFSPKTEELRKLTALAASQDAPVLLMSRKNLEAERIALFIHSQSKRAKHPFYNLNFAAIPSHLHASRLFGYRKPDNMLQRGALDLAGAGTLFLENIDALSWDLQGELLRVMQDMEFQRATELKSTRFKARLILSAADELAAKVEDGNFRQDLYYRIQVLPITIPSLTERKDDIPAIAEEYARWYGERVARKVELTPALKNLLKEREWPDGIPQFYEAINKVLSFREVKQTGVELDMIKEVNAPEMKFLREDNGSLPAPLFNELVTNPRLTLEDLEKEYIHRVLTTNRGNMSESARLLGISRKTLYDKVKKYGLTKKSATG
ncbi:MAG: sigma-54-dependent Fis family transcriptional regulator [Leptospiraceae bacterium]|nr:sigma-54-dependent Fis family transcriptional regulator [Leptospiraceae bacterium]